MVRHTLVHHRAVPVAIDMGLEALSTTPPHLADLVRGQAPIGEALEASKDLIPAARDMKII